MGKATGPPQFTPYELPIQPLRTFENRLPTDNGELHLLVPAGVGDNLWVAGKFWSLVEQRDVTFWLPADEQRRSGDVYRMLGWKYGYMPGLTTEWIWGRPGSPAIPDTGAVLSIQPNRHLEHGHHISKWYPDLPWRNPVELIRHRYERVYRREAGQPRYVVVFTSQQGYMEDGGNLLPGTWARICRQIEKDIAPVLLIGAGKDVPFLSKILNIFDPTMTPVMNAPLETLYSIYEGAEMVVGAHAGPLILSAYMGVPTLQAYPRWLAPMCGTWEPEDKPWGACFLDELENTVREGIRFEGFEQGARMNADTEPPIKMHIPEPIPPRPTEHRPATKKAPPPVKEWTPVANLDDPIGDMPNDHTCPNCGMKYRVYNGTDECPMCRRVNEKSALEPALAEGI